MKKEDEILSKLEDFNNQKEAIEDFLKEFDGNKRLIKEVKKEFKLLTIQAELLEWVTEDPGDLPF